MYVQDKKGVVVYFLVIAFTLILGIVSQLYIKAVFARWKQVDSASGITGYQAARNMLDQNGLHHVEILRNHGADLSDFYDPRSNTLNLSDASYYGSSIASIAVACHEAGHAVQYAKNYAPVKLRGGLLPFAQTGSHIWIFLLMAGIYLHMVHLVYLAIALFAAVVLFQIVTLPVEFDASRRAMAHVDSVAHLSGREHAGARSVLIAAAFTYIAAALSSALMLLYYLSLARNNN